MSKASMLEQLTSVASRAQGYAADVAGAAAEAIEELDNAKADRAQGMTVTIQATGWTKDAGQDLQYPYYYDIAAQVTAADRADVVIETASLRGAGTCGFCPTVETLGNIIRVRAQQVPDKEIRAQCWITRGEPQEPAQGAQDPAKEKE